VIQYEGRIELIPVRNLSEARGSLKGMDKTIKRETREPVVAATPSGAGPPPR